MQKEQLLAELQIDENVTVIFNENKAVAGTITDIDFSRRYSPSIFVDNNEITLSSFTEKAIVLKTEKYQQELRKKKITSLAKLTGCDARYLLGMDNISEDDENDILNALRELKSVLDKKLAKLPEKPDSKSMTIDTYRDSYAVKHTTETDIESAFQQEMTNRSTYFEKQNERVENQIKKNPT
ncbi:hypothetical protein [Alteromonas macleodii]|uniref:hypothetical protein n=1 Tax=Alteromonas macleodii TaxID=28108 RepID=UPI0031404B31|tara:strand:- start:17294 stop:17839 length:546 start_codon:yes stop_codon:yes gene_type:complete